MKNVVCLLGSPRPKGNSAMMAQALCQSAAVAGAQVTTFALNSLTYRGCQGCLACKKEAEACVLNDGLTPMLEAVRACDVLVLATPVYFGEVTSQLKGFIDRTFAYLKPNYPRLPRGERSRLAPGKTLVFNWVRDPIRTTETFNYLDSQLLGSAWSLATGYSNLSDGSARSVNLRRFRENRPLDQSDDLVERDRRLRRVNDGFELEE